METDTTTPYRKEGPPPIVELRGVAKTFFRDTEPVPRPHIIVNTAAGPGPAIRLLERRLSE